LSENVLDRIVQKKYSEIEAAKKQVPIEQLLDKLSEVDPPRDFCNAITFSNPNRDVRLIAEVKKASPSQGLIRKDFEPVEIAGSYESAGAACISVLTDEHFFQGHLDYLMRVRNAVNIPVLRKDFVIDEYQIIEGRAAGADAILLIAECLDDQTLNELHQKIIELGMTPLVEFYEASNLPRVMALNPMLVGVNNRDLRSFEVSIEHVIHMRSKIDPSIPLVAESGIFTREDVGRLKQNGIQAMLVGQSLMEQSDIESATRRLLQGNLDQSE